MPSPKPSHSRRRTLSTSIATAFSPTASTTNSPIVPSPHSRLPSHTHVESRRSSSDSVEMSTLSSGAESDEETGLTAASRERRRIKKGRKRGLSGAGRMNDAGARGGDGAAAEERYREEDEGDRIVNGIQVTKAERKLADKHVLKSMAINGLLIGLWYIFSLLISVYNKWMFSPEHLDFHFPLFVTSLHMLVQFTLSCIVLFFIPHLRPGYIKPKPIPQSDSLSSSEHSDDEDETFFQNEGNAQDPNKPVMTKWFYFTRITPCGLATGLDIGLGNMSLKYITLAFYTMCKSSSLAFVLIFAFLFRLERPTLLLCSIITIMTVGVVMMVFGEVAFVAIGFILVITASCLSGLRWSLTQLLLLRNPATGNPFSGIFFLAPVMFAALFCIAIPVEGFGKVLGRFDLLIEDRGLFMSLGLIAFPGVVAFCMTSSEFALLQRTSVVTLSICGIFKEVLTISVAATIFHDTLTPINISGLLVTIASIAGYNYIKIKQMRGEAVREVLAKEAQDEDDEEVRRSLLFERNSMGGTTPRTPNFGDGMGGFERVNEEGTDGVREERR